MYQIHLHRSYILSPGDGRPKIRDSAACAGQLRSGLAAACDLVPRVFVLSFHFLNWLPSLLLLSICLPSMRTGLQSVLVLWSSLQVAHAFQFTFGSLTQCDALTISWTGGTAPYQLLITPDFAVPQNVSIPADAFADGQGSFTVQLAYAAGQKLLLTMSDATGFGSGGSTSVLVVGSSQGGSCDINSSTPAFSFELNSALQQCRPYTVSGYPGAIQPATFIGIVAGGTSVILTLPSGSASFDWNANVAQGTSMIFLMVDAAGRSGGSSDFRTVGASDDNTCLNNLSPSSTPGTPTSFASPTSGAATSSGASTATSSSNSSGGISIAAIAGSAIGALIFLAAIITLGLFFFRRKRDKWVDGSYTIKKPRRAQSEIDLTYDPVYTSNTHPYTHGSATPMAPGTPFSHSSPYLDEPPHPQYPARYQLPSEYSQNSAPSHHQTSYSTPHTDSFNPYTSSEAPSTIVQPFVDPPTIRNSMTTTQRKAASAGASAVTPSRFVVHTDVEDNPPLNADEIVELPPQYSDRRGPFIHHGLSSNSQQVQLPPGASAPSLSKS